MQAALPGQQQLLHRQRAATTSVAPVMPGSLQALIITCWLAGVVQARTVAEGCGAEQQPTTFLDVLLNMCRGHELAWCLCLAAGGGGHVRGKGRLL